MMRAVTIGVMLTSGALFAWRLPLARLMDILQPLVVALSIMIAALLVRLNRGMPTLDWKSLESSERKILTLRIVELTREYIVVLVIQAATLLAFLVIAVNNLALGSLLTQMAISAAAGGLIALCVTRMGYIIWRDYDIVCLQKKLIDESADREAVEKASEEALSKVTAIRGSGLRGPSRVEPSSWTE
jgi:hypothetical protein